MDVEVKALAQENTTQQEIVDLVQKAQEALRQVQVQDVIVIQEFRLPEEVEEKEEDKEDKEDKEEGEIGLFVLTVKLPNPYALSSQAARGAHHYD